MHHITHIHKVLFRLMACYLSFAGLSTIAEGRQVGDPGVRFDQGLINQNRDDSSRNYWMMNNWKNAGKSGGIPWFSSNAPKVTMWPSQAGQIDSKINQVAQMGGGVLLCKAGTYNFYRKVVMKRGVIIRGEGMGRTTFRFHHRSTGGTSAFDAYNDDTVGFESFTVEYVAPNGRKPRDYDMENNPHGLNNLYVSLINFGGSAKNGFAQSIHVKNAGNSPIDLSSASSRNTVRRVNIEGAYNKGGGGRGYFRIFGDSNLVYANQASKIRHVSIQAGAKYNVVIRNNFRQDINFHTDDDGYNLVESNTVNLPKALIDAHPGWHAFLTPWSFRHAPVGPRNYVYHNTFNRNGKRDTFVNTDGKESPLWWSPVYRPFDRYRKCYNTDKEPIGRTFYPATNVTF